MEGSYNLLLSYNLLIYITAKATDRRKIQRSFLEHTRFCKKMSYPLPNYSFSQINPDIVYSASEATTQTRPHPHPPRQRDRLALDPLDPNSFGTTNNLDQNNFRARSTIGLDKESTRYFRDIENPCGAHSSNLTVSPTPVTTNFFVSGHAVPDPTAYNLANPQHHLDIHDPSILSNCAKFQEDDDWLKQLVTAAYGDTPNFQEIPQGTNYYTDATTLSGLDIQETGHLKGFTSDAPGSNYADVHYTAQPQRSSTNAYYSELPSIIPSATNYNRVEPLGISSSSPLSVPRRPDRNMAKHNGLGPSYIFTPVHSAPSVTMQKTAGLGSHVPAQRHLAASMSNHNEFQSHTSTTHDLYLEANPDHLESSGIPNHARSSITCRHALDMTNHNNLGPSDNPIPSYLTPKVNNLNNLDPSTMSPQRRVNPKVCNTSSVEPLDTSALCHPVGIEGLEPSDISTSRHLVPDMVNPNGPESSSTSTEYDVDYDDVFALFTTLNDDPQTLSNNSEIGHLNDFNAPIVDHNHVPEALELHTGHCCTDHPASDAGSEEKPPRRRKYQKRNKSNVSPARMKSRERKKRVRKTDPNSGRRYTSTRKRRTDPKYRYFCAIPTCPASQEQGSKGIVTKEEAERHLASHGPRRYVCTLPHTECAARYYGRRDGLRK